MNALSTKPATSEDSELADLLLQCKRDDKQAFSRLYQKTASRLNGIAYRITRNIDSANEVTQEAYIQIWNNRAQYEPEKSLAFTWLASITRYRAYDRLRYEKRRHQQDTLTFDGVNLSEVELTRINEHSTAMNLSAHSEQALTNCLSKLEQNQSQSILMAYMYGHSREDISVYFDTPINTIKSWIRRGLGRLRLCLS